MDVFDPHDADADWWAEAHDLVDALGHTLVSAHAGSSISLLPRQIDAMFRDAHTLKGLLRTLDATELADLASSIEDALEHLRMGPAVHPPDMAPGLLRAVETLAAGCARAQAHVPLDQAALLAVRAHLQGAPSHAPTEQEVGAANASVLPDALLDLNELEQHRVQDAARHGQRIVRVATHLPVALLERGFVEIETSLNALGDILARSLHPVQNNDDDIGLDFIVALCDPQVDAASVELSVHSAATSVHVVRASDVAQAWAQDNSLTPSDDGGLPPATQEASWPAQQTESARSSPEFALTEPELVVPEDAVARLPLARQVPSADPAMGQTVRVDIRRLDRLLFAVSELMIAKQQWGELSHRVRRLPGGMAVAMEMARQQEAMEKKASALQAQLMQVRMVPVGQLFERLLRAGQQAAHELGKEVRFSLHGEATELDKHIAEKLVDPMMHLVRNAVDHGIERPDVRRARGKSSYGTIRLSARTRGRQVVVQVADDGAGIDLNKARKTAVEHHLIAPQAAPLLDEQQIYTLLTQPGFSTRKEVSAYSGRGVGLDVAKTELEALGGALEIAANEPSGSIFSLVTPVTLAIVSALIVASAAERYALPLGHVTETLAFEPNDVFVAGYKRMLRVGGHVMPLTELAETFQLQRAKDKPNMQYVAVVGIGQKRLALLVDDLLAQQDVVIKTLGPRMSEVTSFAGAADVGSSQLVLVLNTLSLLNEAEFAETTSSPTLPQVSDAKR